MAAAAAAATAAGQATSITMAPGGEGGSSSRRSRGEEEERMPMPSRNPLPLSASQEAQVREVFNARVRGLCADDIKGSSSTLSSCLSFLQVSFPAIYSPLLSMLGLHISFFFT
jgi:hypothetical protein